MKQQWKDYYERNREKILAQIMDYRAKNREVYLERERIRKRLARAAKPKQLRMRFSFVSDEQRRANKRQESKHYRARNVEKARARNKEYDARHPEKMRARVSRRRARKAGLPATLTFAEWNEIKKMYDYRCAYCRCTGRLVQEHFIPVVLGGGTTKENIIPSCASCNSKKGIKLLASKPEPYI